MMNSMKENTARKTDTVITLPVFVEKATIRAPITAKPNTVDENTTADIILQTRNAMVKHLKLD